MHRQNLNSDMEEKIRKLEQGEEKPRLLLHCCCAPCACVALVRLAPHFRITALYDNPNIEPEEEYRKRAEELDRFIRAYPFDEPVDLLIAPWENREFRDAVRGLEEEPEGGRRCRACFALRLGRAARGAEREGCEFYTTTLTTGSRKDAALIAEIGRIFEREGLFFLPADFKKKGGVQESARLSGHYGLYRQDYCGCVFSKRERDKRYGV